MSLQTETKLGRPVANLNLRIGDQFSLCSQVAWHQMLGKTILGG